MVSEALLEQVDHGQAPAGEGWFVLNARDARWRRAPGRGRVGQFEGRSVVFPQVGINIRVLGPGEPMWTYPVDETAIRHGAGVEEETTDAAVAYGRFEPSVPVPYEEGWLPG